MEISVNRYYRMVVSHFNINNSIEINLLLLRELFDINPQLVKEAYGLIIDRNITKFIYSPDGVATSQCFYTFYTPNKDIIAMNGFCTCQQFREDVLLTDNGFTCKHEIASIILNCINLDTYGEIKASIRSERELNDIDYIKKLYSLLYY